jgi:hypothetical protein
VQDGDAITGGGAGAAGTASRGGSSFMDGGPFGVGGGFPLLEAGLSDVRYVDPGCVPAMKIQGSRQCDPFSTTQEADCGVGERCVPYVHYADQCKTEEIGTQCAPAGAGTQGDDCSVNDCAAGYVCVTGGTGFQCAALCQFRPNGDTCRNGLLCTPLDVDGYFVCG